MESWNRHTVNLPHAATVVGRMLRHLTHLAQSSAGRVPARDLGLQLMDLLSEADDGLEEGAARQVCQNGAELGRRLVQAVEAAELGNDRLGQQVRNLFECLGFPQEGSALSLRAGEDPQSLLRPL